MSKPVRMKLASLWRRSSWRRNLYTCGTATTIAVVLACIFSWTTSKRPLAVLFQTPPRQEDVDCSFAYPGPLRASDLNCFLDVFPHAAPLLRVSDGQVIFTRPSAAALLTTAASDPKPVPIFILFKDRISVLMETLRNLYRYLRTPFQLIIIDDGSTFPAAVNFLSRLEESGVLVHRNKRRWEAFDDFYNEVAAFIHRYTTDRGLRYFVLTDPDCALDSAPPDLLRVYQAALEDLDLDVVGAALRWDDWPETLDGSDFEDKISGLEARAFKHRGRNYYYIEAMVDTTFAMYRVADGPVQRFAGRHIRMLPPLGARHLDFYLNKSSLPADYKYYHSQARAKQVNHMAFLD